MTKQYLGDGVYADFDGHHIVLTTENGLDITNTICLEDQVYHSLVRYEARLSDEGLWVEHSTHAAIKGRNSEITLEPRPNYCDRGNFLAKLHPTGILARDIDEQDGWPRYYMDREHAKAEIVAWMRKRGEL